MKHDRFFQQQCLVAMPGLEGSYFEKAVIYLIEHNNEGAFGLVINHPIDVSVDEILTQINLDYEDNLHPQPVFIGGPVENQRGFVLHRPSPNKTWEQQITVSEDLAITSSADILQAMAAGQDISEYLIVLGYSGWGAGQLEQEMADNAWINVDIPVTQLLALPPDQRLTAALDELGICYAQLASNAGHA